MLEVPQTVLSFLHYRPSASDGRLWMSRVDGCDVQQPHLSLEGRGGNEGLGEWGRADE